jgi:hypothetical protein
LEHVREGIAECRLNDARSVVSKEIFRTRFHSNVAE